MGRAPDAGLMNTNNELLLQAVPALVKRFSFAAFKINAGISDLYF